MKSWIVFRASLLMTVLGQIALFAECSGLKNRGCMLRSYLLEFDGWEVDGGCG